MQHKPHGKRALGITMLSNSSVSEHVKLRSSRHSNLKTHERYQRLTAENLDKKYEAMNPSLRSPSTSEPVPSPRKNSSPPPVDKQISRVSPYNGNTHTQPTYHPPSQIVININSGDPHHVTPSSVRRQSNNNFESSVNNLASNQDFLKLLAKQVSEEMRKGDWIDLSGTYLFVWICEPRNFFPINHIFDCFFFVKQKLLLLIAFQ